MMDFIHCRHHWESKKIKHKAGEDIGNLQIHKRLPWKGFLQTKKANKPIEK
jgi:hypothetical protein